MEKEKNMFACVVQMFLLCLRRTVSPELQCFCAINFLQPRLRPSQGQSAAVSHLLAFHLRLNWAAAKNVLLIKHLREQF